MNIVMVLFIKPPINRAKIKTQTRLTQELKTLICMQFVSCEMAKNYCLLTLAENVGWKKDSRFLFSHDAETQGPCILCKPFAIEL